jgi:hypothetical protein
MVGFARMKIAGADSAVRFDDEVEILRDILPRPGSHHPHPSEANQYWAEPIVIDQPRCSVHISPDWEEPREDSHRLDIGRLFPAWLQPPSPAARIYRSK